MTMITPRFRLAVGLVGLMVSLLFAALLMGLIPDQKGERRRGRAALAEAVALSTSNFVTQQQWERLETYLKIVVSRNDEMASAAVRSSDGVGVVVVGDHDPWTSMSGTHSSDTQVRVAIFSGPREWGQLELRFARGDEFFGWSLTDSHVARLIVFIAASGFLVFFFYLGQMLTQLDPSQAIPPRVRAAFDTIAGGLLVVDLKGRILLANNSMANWLGFAPDRLIGRKVQDFGWENAEGCQLEPNEAPWMQCLSTGLPGESASVQLQVGPEDRRSFIVNCSPVMSSAGGKHGGVLVSFDDVTQLERRTDELGKAKLAAEEANHAKSAFLANMSHEIRTPMNAILGFTDVLRRGYGSSSMNPRKYLDIIHSSGSHLLNLINDILDLSKVEAGKLEVERLRCAPHLIIQDVLNVLSIRAQEKGIELKFQPTHSLPEAIESDPARLRQIITNLVGNAIKFTETGGVYVDARIEQGEHTLLWIDVRDTGIGMTDEQARRIFDPFSQADSSVTRRFGGTGLGLAISLKFANALGGGITVSSQPGKGSTFSIRIATGSLSESRILKPDELKFEESASNGTQEEWRFERGRILVVDDGPENRELAKLVLKEAGLEFVGAENGLEGVDRAMTDKFDLIFMDMQMPVMDGHTATRKLRAAGISTPIYALTANAMKGFEAECLESGCTGFLTKPIDIDLLLDTVARELGGKKVAKADPNLSQPSLSQSSLSQPQESPNEIPGAEDLEPIYSSLPDDPDFQSIVVSFLERLETRLQEMDAALRQPDLPELAKLAHWLKGSGGTVGFAQFTEPAIELERAAKADDRTRCEEGLQVVKKLAQRVRVKPATDAAELLVP